MSLATQEHVWRRPERAQLFAVHDDRVSYERAVETFTRWRRGPIPVFTAGRRDLEAAAIRARSLYDGIASFAPADVGIVLDASLDDLVKPFAKRWTTSLDLEDEASVLVVGTYASLDWQFVRKLLMWSIRTGASIGFLTGRDAASLSWLAAKQWAAPKASVGESVFVSAVDDAQKSDSARVLSVENDDVRAILLAQSWRKVFVQGHGTDDSLNLGAFTICGKNDAVALQSDTTLRPRCGYGHPCYKDEAKLVPIREVAAIDVVLSSCNSGPLAGLGSYDPKYVLALSAIDGTARSITAAISVHDSDFADNHRWLNGADLDKSLRDRHPYPAFWQLGLPRATAKTITAPALPLLTQRIAERVHAHLGLDLLAPKHPLRPRFDRLARKLNASLSRARRYEDQELGGAGTSALRDDVQSLDVAIANRLAQCPEDDLLYFSGYYADRSTIGEVTDVTCDCGIIAQSYVRRGIVPLIPDTAWIHCLACGERSVRFAGAPTIHCAPTPRIQPGGTLHVRAEVAFEGKSAVHVGLFVPSHVRSHARIEPALRRLKKPGAVDFEIHFDERVPPQAYSFTLFAVQDLGLATCRQRIGIDPRREEAR